MNYFDRDGQPLERNEWARRFEQEAFRTVALDDVGDVQVSTVWLGINHRHGTGSPLIFETMVFGGARLEAVALLDRGRSTRRPRSRAGPRPRRPAGLVVSAPLVLECGHVAERKERLRYGNEKWCLICCNWQFLVVQEVSA